MEASPYRQACDRCHAQKLRCKREPDCSGGACIRCFNAKVQCVSSPSLRVRRATQGRRPQSASIEWEAPRRDSMKSVTQSDATDETQPNTVAVTPAVFSMGNFGHLNTSAADSSSSSSTSSQGNCASQFTFEGLLDFSFPPRDSTEDLMIGNGSHQPTDTDKLVFTTIEQASTTSSCQQSSSREHRVQTSLLARSNDRHTEQEGCVLDLSQANAELYQHLVAVKKAKYVPQTWPIDQTLLVSYRLLRTLSTLPDNMPFQNDGGTILLIFSCYTRLLEIHTALFENLGTLSPILVDNLTEPTQATLPSLRIGAFELDAQSDTYLSFLISLAESLLIQARSAVLRISGGIQNSDSMTVSINTRMVTGETEDTLNGAPGDSWQLDGLWRSLASSEQTYRELRDKASKAWLHHGE